MSSEADINVATAEEPQPEGRVEEHESMSFANIVLTVNNHRVRLPIHVFGDSDTFYSIVKKATDQCQDAESEVRLDLDEAEEEDLWRFIQFMNPRRLTGEVVLGVAEHVSVLRFSTKWGFKNVRASTIRDFPAVDVVDKIVLAREHRIEEWLVPSLDAYARLGRSITMADVERLGSIYIFKIISIRDGMKRSAAVPCGESHIVWPESLCRMTYDFTELLKTLFAEEIKPLDIQHPPMASSNLDEYYLAEIYFLVEGCLFQSYRQLFEVSPVFREMFSLPIREGEQPDGCLKSQPLRLDGIKRADFKPFVELINPTPSADVNFTISEWTSILKLSTMWDFTGIRQLTIKHMFKVQLTTPQRIDLARQYHIKEWFLPALNWYARQANPVTEQDVAVLGWDYILRILQARDNMGRIALANQFQLINLPCIPPRRCPPGHQHHLTLIPGIQARTNYDFTQAIRMAFREELEMFFPQRSSDLVSVNTITGIQLVQLRTTWS